MADVNTPSKEYQALAAAWELPRTLMGGTKAMRLAGVKYLPKEQAESDDAYSARLKRTTLFNAFRKTVRDMTGKVFSKQIALGKDVPILIKDYAENIDLAGRHLNVFARDVFFDAMQPGIAFILTEMPEQVTEGSGRNGEVTKADEIAAGRRPYLIHVKAEDIIGWQSATIDGQVTLTQVRILEQVSIPDGDWGETCIQQVRVLYPGRWQIWREVTTGPNKGKWMMYRSGTTSLSRIPLAPVYLNRIGFMAGAPPLEDLADLNVAHWQSQSDQRNILHVARVPILAMFGFGEDDTVEIGASRAVRTTSSDADMKYVEHTGAAMGAGDKDIANLEFQMQTQGLQLLIPQPGGKTATGEVHDDIKENSQLAMMANALGDAIEMSFGFMAEFMNAKADGDKAGGSVTVNTDFGITAAAAVDVPNIIAAVNAGLLDKETGIEELKRRGFLMESVVAATVLARIDEQAPELNTNNPMDLGGTPKKPAAAAGANA